MDQEDIVYISGGVSVVGVWSLNCVQLFVAPWAVAQQAPLSMEFPRQGYWNGLPFPSPGDLPDRGIKPLSPALAGRFFTISMIAMKIEVTQSCPTLCDPTDCSLPGSSIHGIFQARILEWVAISFSSDCHSSDVYHIP